MWDVGTGNLLESGGDLSELGCIEPAREVRSDPSQVRSSRSLQQARSLVREGGVRNPSILRIRSSLEEASRDQAIDQACHAARRQHHPVGQITHPERSVRRATEPQEDVVLGEGHAMPVSQFSIERLDHVVMRVEQGLPCTQLDLRETARHLLLLCQAYRAETCVLKDPAAIICACNYRKGVLGRVRSDTG